MIICNLIIIQDILLLVTILRIVLHDRHPSVRDETGRRLGAWFGRSHGDNSPTLAWDYKTYPCIGSRCSQATFISSTTFPKKSHPLKKMNCIQQQPQKSGEDNLY